MRISTNDRSLTALAILIFIAVWWIASLVVSSEIILPSPGRVFKEMISLMKERDFHRAIITTIGEGIVSAILIVALGTVLGTVMGIYRIVWKILRPIVLIAQSVPVISWLVLIVFSLGMGFKSVISITVFSLTPIVILNTASGISDVDERLVEMAKVFKVSRWKTFRVIYLGSLVPFALASLEIVAGNVWKTTVVAEFLAGSGGIGVMIAWARSYVNTTKVIALTLYAVILAFAFECLSRLFLRRLKARWKSFL